MGYANGGDVPSCEHGDVRVVKSRTHGRPLFSNPKVNASEGWDHRPGRSRSPSRSTRAQREAGGAPRYPHPPARPPSTPGPRARLVSPRKPHLYKFCIGWAFRASAEAEGAEDAGDAAGARGAGVGARGAVTRARRGEGVFDGPVVPRADGR